MYEIPTDICESATAPVSATAMPVVKQYAIPVAQRIPCGPHSTEIESPAGIIIVLIGVSVPTVGAEALLCSLKYAAAAPLFESVMFVITPTEAFTLVAFVVAALIKWWCVDAPCAVDGMGVVS